MMTVEVVLAGPPVGNSDELVWKGPEKTTLYCVKKRGNSTSTYSVGRVMFINGKWDAWVACGTMKSDDLDEAKAWVYTVARMECMA